MIVSANTKTSGTFIEAVKESVVAAGRYNTGDAVAPAAILSPAQR